jgi:hypothetical protein
VTQASQLSQQSTPVKKKREIQREPKETTTETPAKLALGAPSFLGTTTTPPPVLAS